MAKRFTDTNKYKKPFIRGLQGAYKLLWDYLYHDCDHAGIWIVDFDIAQIYIGSDMKVNQRDALKFFKEKIIVIDNGEKWFIPSFIEFQYGVLNPENRAHNSVLKILEKYNIKDLTSPLQGDKDKDKDKEQDKDKFTPPSLDEVKEYFKEKGYKIEAAITAFNYYDVAGWKDRDGKKVKSWKQKMISVWFKDENKEGDNIIRCKNGK
jgi:hypothetical protein